MQRRFKMDFKAWANVADRSCRARLNANRLAAECHNSRSISRTEFVMIQDRFRSDSACRALAGEFYMFKFLAKRMANRDPASSDDEKTRDRALFESFLLHTRRLRDFFFHEGHRSEDLVAAQFVPNWKLLRPATTRYLHAHKQHLDQSLGRLTVKKLNLAGVDWDIATIIDEISALIELFQKNLPSELRTRFESVTPEKSSPA
jgi:hypothetical protein